MKKFWRSFKARVAYNDALNHYNLGQARKARDLADAVLRIDPNHPGALWLTGTLV